MMWLFGIYPYGVLVYPLMEGQQGIGNMNPTQLFSNKWLGKPIGRILFMSPSINGKFEFKVSSPTQSSNS